MPAIITFFSVLIYSLASAPVALAQTINILDPDSPYTNLYALRPSSYVRTVILWLLGGSGIAAFLYLLIGGFQWITSSGDKDAAEKARKKIMFAVTGLAVVFSAYAIVFILRAVFRVDLLGFTITSIQ
jgi:hypothetical protein